MLGGLDKCNELQFSRADFVACGMNELEAVDASTI